MKYMTLIAFLITPLIRFAETTIDITSFVPLDSKNYRDPASEVSGVVTQDNPEYTSVLVVADPGKSEGHYVAHLTKTGNFCQVISSVFGSVEVRFDDGAESTKTAAKSYIPRK